LPTIVIDTEDLIQNHSHPVQVLVRDLHEDAAAVLQQLPRQHQPIPQVREVRVHAERPGIAIRLDGLGLAGQVLFAVLHVAASDLGLEVGGEADAVGRVHVDHLDLAAQVLAMGEGGHDLERVAEDHAVGPVDVVLVEADGLAILLLRVGEHVALDVLASHSAEDGLGRDALVDVQGHGVDDELLHLALAGPFQPRLPVAEHPPQLGGLLLRQPAGLLCLGEQVGGAVPLRRGIRA
jgi:hypothetical protein